MQVSDGMTEAVLTVGPGHTLRAAARLMAERKVGAAIVIDPEQPGPGIITERDVVSAIGEGQDPDSETVADHLSSNLTFAAPNWSLERAAEAMISGRFRHLLVISGGEIARRAVDARHRPLLDDRRRVVRYGRDAGRFRLDRYDPTGVVRTRRSALRASSRASALEASQRSPRGSRGPSG